MVDFQFKMYSPVLPTKAVATYKNNKNLKTGFGFDFDETIQSRPEQVDAYYQTGSRGLLYGFADYKVMDNYWAGIQAGVGYEMLSSYNQKGSEIEDS